MEIQELQEEYKNTFKSELGIWKIHFMTLKAFLKMGCVEVKETCVAISFPEHTCLLVSTKTLSSGIINFQRPRF